METARVRIGENVALRTTVNRLRANGQRTSAGRRPGAKDLALGGAMAALTLLERANEFADSRVERAQQKETAAAEAELTTLHLREFPPARRQVITARRERVGPARKLLQRKPSKPSSHRLAAQAVADATWERLQAHDPVTVITEVDSAFADSAFPAVCVDAGVDGRTKFVTAAVIFPGPRIVTGMVRDPGARRARERTLAEVADVYRDAVASTVIATAKEGFANAPAADELRVIVVRRERKPLRRVAKPVVVYRGIFTRAMLDRDWSKASAARVIADAKGVLINDRGDRPLKAVIVRRRSELAQLLDRVEGAG